LNRRGAALICSVGTISKAPQMKLDQPSLFDVLGMPEGFRYVPDVIGAAEEADLVTRFADLPFKEFEFHGFIGKRRVVSFGWRYDFNGGGLQQAVPIPSFLLAVREQAASFAELAPDQLQHVLITEYCRGAAIGWHRDRANFADVIGISLLGPCSFRMRRKDGRGWQRASLRLDRRSAYLLRGPSRDQWEHSIPAVDELRYSITFRQIRLDARGL
jgi:alkylated DNA repair dioxygenase AlkB